MKTVFVVILIQLLSVTIKAEEKASCHPLGPKLIGTYKALICLDDNGNGCFDDPDGCLLPFPCEIYQGFEYLGKKADGTEAAVKTLAVDESKLIQIDKLTAGQMDPCKIEGKKIVDTVHVQLRLLKILL